MKMAGRSDAWRELSASGQLGRFLLVCLGVWLHAADSLVTATIVPAIVGDIGGIAYVGWTIAVYQIGAVIAGSATAMLGQRVGVRRILVAAALLYGSGCLFGAVAPTMAVLLSGRFVQGVGGGMLVSLSYVVIQQSFAEHLWGRLFGLVAVVWSAGSLLGPLIGGVFANFGAWRWAFWFFAGQAGLLGAMAAVLVAARPDGAGSAGKWPLLPLLTLSLATLLIAQAAIAEQPAASVVECVAGLALLYLAGRIDQRSDHRLLPAQTLDLRHPVGAGLLTAFALSVATTGFWAYGPLILKIMFGTDPLISGYILAGEALAWSAATIAVSRVALSAGRILIRAGAAFVLVGAAGFALAVPSGSFAGIVACALLQGLGFGISWPSIVHRTVRFSNPGESTLAAAAPGTVQRIGYSVGAAAAGIAANASGLAEGISTAVARTAGFWVFAGFIPILIVGLLSAWRFTRKNR